MLIKFGDVFNYGEKDYVFLAKTEDIIYVAEILDPESTKKIKIFAEREISRNKDGWQKRPIFCYVELSTEEYKDRMAHLHKAERETSLLQIESLGYALKEQDMKEIQKEIISGPLPLELKGLVKDIEIK